MKMSDTIVKTNTPVPKKKRVEITEVLLSMHQGFIEDVKPTWEKWERETSAAANK